ncbi:MAG: GIY-YIG nuclease family protein [Parachlamydiales bacterium]|nr:GIY-YIG nuclease family protein [Parachlamydiales bacterium]
MKVKWELYIIQAKSKKLYTGITTDLDRRLKDHQNGKKGARFFRFSGPEKVLYRESHPNRSKATKREIEIKKMSRKEKLELIESTNCRLRPRGRRREAIDISQDL